LDFNYVTIRDAIRYGLDLVFFPALSIGVLVYICGTVILQIRHARDRVRRLTGALLPLVAAAFLFISTNHSAEEISTALSLKFGIIEFLIGAAIGGAAIFVGRILAASEAEIGPTLHVLFLTAGGAFLVYVVLLGALPSLNFYLFGCISGAAVYVIGRGWLWPQDVREGIDHVEEETKEAGSSPGSVERERPPEIHPPSV
jgi:hypothetical protein